MKIHKDEIEYKKESVLRAIAASLLLRAEFNYLDLHAGQNDMRGYGLGVAAEKTLFEYCVRLRQGLTQDQFLDAATDHGGDFEGLLDHVRDNVIVSFTVDA